MAALPVPPAYALIYEHTVHKHLAGEKRKSFRQVFKLANNTIADTIILKTFRQSKNAILMYRLQGSIWELYPNAFINTEFGQSNCIKSVLITGLYNDSIKVNDSSKSIKRATEFIKTKAIASSYVAIIGYTGIVDALKNVSYYEF